jgi:hypothetical protein
MTEKTFVQQQLIGVMAGLVPAIHVLFQERRGCPA